MTRTFTPPPDLQPGRGHVAISYATRLKKCHICLAVGGQGSLNVKIDPLQRRAKVLKGIGYPEWF